MRVRIRRIAKWGCLSIGSVMLVAAGVGYWWTFAFALYWNFGSPPRTFTIAIATTGCEAGRLPWTVNGILSWQWYSFPSNTKPGVVPQYSSRWGAPTLAIPMSNLALFTLGAGAIFWRLDRRRAAHECPKCRYDRRGLAEGAVCPECGAG